MEGCERAVQRTSGRVTELGDVVEAIVKRLMPAPSRLSYLRELEEACAQGWLLSTSELADLLRLTPRTITDYGEEFSDVGFTFARAGKRKGGEIAWRVSASLHKEMTSRKTYQNAYTKTGSIQVLSSQGESPSKQFIKSWNYHMHNNFIQLAKLS